MTRISILLASALLTAGCNDFGGTTLVKIFKYKMGKTEVIQLTDIEARISPNILAVEDPMNYTGAVSESGFTNATSSYLLRSEGRTYLFDTGMGGGMVTNLEGVGEVHGNIEKIFLTHMHMDHIGELIKYDRIAFPRAHLYIPRAEYEYWMNDDNMAANPKTPFLKARAVLDVYKDRITLFDPASIEDGGTELEEGITAFAAPGHTPGHTIYLVESGRKKLLIWGDITHLTELQVKYPELSVRYDTDPAQAAATRAEVLKYASDNKIPVAGMHIIYPGFGKIKAKDGKYNFAPVRAKQRPFTGD